MEEAIHNAFTALSLALTVPTLFGCIGVVWLWSHSALKAWRLSHKTETHWFVIGVAAGFIGSVVDNTYWGLAWLAEFYDHPARDWLFRNGVYPNTVFRQCATTFAAFCHIRAAVDSNSVGFKVMLLVSWLVGVSLAVLFYLTG